MDNYASQPFTEVPQVQSKVKVHIDGYECVFACNEMVTRMMGDLVRDYRMVRKEVLTNEHDRATSR